MYFEPSDSASRSSATRAASWWENVPPATGGVTFEKGTATTDTEAYATLIARIGLYGTSFLTEKVISEEDKATASETTFRNLFHTVVNDPKLLAALDVVALPLRRQVLGRRKTDTAKGDSKPAALEGSIDHDPQLSLVRVFGIPVLDPSSDFEQVIKSENNNAKGVSMATSTHVSLDLFCRLTTIIQLCLQVWGAQHYVTSSSASNSVVPLKYSACLATMFCRPSEPSPSSAKLEEALQVAVFYSLSSTVAIGMGGIETRRTVFLGLRKQMVSGLQHTLRVLTLYLTTVLGGKKSSTGASGLTDGKAAEGNPLDAILGQRQTDVDSQMGGAPVLTVTVGHPEKSETVPFTDLSLSARTLFSLVTAELKALQFLRQPGEFEAVRHALEEFIRALPLAIPDFQLRAESGKDVEVQSLMHAIVECTLYPSSPALLSEGILRDLVGLMGKESFLAEAKRSLGFGSSAPPTPAMEKTLIEWMDAVLYPNERKTDTPTATTTAATTTGNQPTTDSADDGAATPSPAPESKMEKEESGLEGDEAPSSGNILESEVEVKATAASSSGAAMAEALVFSNPSAFFSLLFARLLSKTPLEEGIVSVPLTDALVQEVSRSEDMNLVKRLFFYRIEAALSAVSKVIPLLQVAPVPAAVPGQPSTALPQLSILQELVSSSLHAAILSEMNSDVRVVELLLYIHHVQSLTRRTTRKVMGFPLNIFTVTFTQMPPMVDLVLDKLSRLEGLPSAGFFLPLLRTFGCDFTIAGSDFSYALGLGAPIPATTQASSLCYTVCASVATISLKHAQEQMKAMQVEVIEHPKFPLAFAFMASVLSDFWDRQPGFDRFSQSCIGYLQVVFSGFVRFLAAGSFAHKIHPVFMAHFAVNSSTGVAKYLFPTIHRAMHMPMRAQDERESGGAEVAAGTLRASSPLVEAMWDATPQNICDSHDALLQVLKSKTPPSNAKLILHLIRPWQEEDAKNKEKKTRMEQLVATIVTEINKDVAKAMDVAYHLGLAIVQRTFLGTTDSAVCHRFLRALHENSFIGTFETVSHVLSTLRRSLPFCPALVADGQTALIAAIHHTFLKPMIVLSLKDDPIVIRSKTLLKSLSQALVTLHRPKEPCQLLDQWIVDVTCTVDECIKINRFVALQVASKCNDIIGILSRSEKLLRFCEKRWQKECPAAASLVATACATLNPLDPKYGPVDSTLPLFEGRTPPPRKEPPPPVERPKASTQPSTSDRSGLLKPPAAADASKNRPDEASKNGDQRRTREREGDRDRRDDERHSNRHRDRGDRGENRDGGDKSQKDKERADEGRPADVGTRDGKAREQDRNSGRERDRDRDWERDRQGNDSRKRGRDDFGQNRETDLDRGKRSDGQGTGGNRRDERDGRGQDRDRDRQRDSDAHRSKNEDKGGRPEEGRMSTSNVKADRDGPQRERDRDRGNNASPSGQGRDQRNANNRDRPNDSQQQPRDRDVGSPGGGNRLDRWNRPDDRREGNGDRYQGRGDNRGRDGPEPSRQNQSNDERRDIDRKRRREDEPINSPRQEGPGPARDPKQNDDSKQQQQGSPKDAEQGGDDQGPSAGSGDRKKRWFRRK